MLRIEQQDQDLRLRRMRCQQGSNEKAKVSPKLQSDIPRSIPPEKTTPIVYQEEDRGNQDNQKKTQTTALVEE